MKNIARTDLALELQEEIKDNENLNGIKIINRIDKKNGIRESKIIVQNEIGEKNIGKPIGTYITLESDDLNRFTTQYHNNISKLLLENLNKLLENAKHILVAGLGNRDVTPDSLGPLVVENLFVTRHLKKAGILRTGKDVSAIAMGVMAQTGMEASEILKGIIDKTKPDALIVIDALAARNSNRLNRTIQISDTGISPGSGVGNNRNAINYKSMGIKVIAIGVPTVIGIPNIINDTLDKIFLMLGKDKFNENISDFTEQERYELICKILEPYMAEMFVTPKNIDESIKCISYTISEALNKFSE